METFKGYLRDLVIFGLLLFIFILITGSYPVMASTYTFTQDYTQVNMSVQWAYSGSSVPAGYFQLTTNSILVSCTGYRSPCYSLPSYIVYDTWSNGATLTWQLHTDTVMFQNVRAGNVISSYCTDCGSYFSDASFQNGYFNGKIEFSNTTNWNNTLTSIPINTNFYINTWIGSFSQFKTYHIDLDYPNGTLKTEWVIFGQNYSFPIQEASIVNLTDPAGNYTVRLIDFNNATEMTNSTILITGEGGYSTPANTVKFYPDVSETNSKNINLFYNIDTVNRYWAGSPWVYVNYYNWNTGANNWDTTENTLVLNVNPGLTGAINLSSYINSYNMSKTKFKGLLVDSIIYPYYGNIVYSDYIIYNATNNNNSTPPTPTPNVTTQQPTPLPTPFITTTPNQGSQGCIQNNTINYNCSYPNSSDVGGFSSASSAVRNLNGSVKSVDYSTHKTVFNAVFPSVFSAMPSKVIALGTYSLLLLVIGFVIKGKR
ncbi:Uncharacterised protein [uncultured archaeon]|nr:Uncharacterised protein [uncultured archaeon]